MFSSLSAALVAEMPFFETALGGAILDGGLSLIKGLFGGRSARKQRAQALQDQALQFVRLRDAAEAGGFNPLTVLGANPEGGMVNPTPALASGEFVADALQSATSTYFNAKQRQRDVERDQLEKALMRQELANMQRQGKAFARSMAFGYEIPQANNYTGVDRANSPPDLRGSGASRTDQRVEPIDLYVPYRHRDGTITYGPNPQIADLDMFASAGILSGEKNVIEGVEATGNIFAPFSMVPQRGTTRPKARPKAQPVEAPANYFTVRHAGPLASFK